MDKMLRSSIILANKCFHGFGGKFKSHFLTPSTKLKLYEGSTAETCTDIWERERDIS
jgi:hypothetical protein